MIDNNFVAYNYSLSCLFMLMIWLSSHFSWKNTQTKAVKNVRDLIL